jgi:Asp-tRNA(Asn)/Glu-tRNA(Gln) amidotransferase A subunit family amidase
MPNPEPHRLSAVEMVGRIEAGSLTAEAIVQSCLDRIREREPVVRAWTHIAGDAALAAARNANRSTLMKGVPFGIKDIFDTADMPTGYGSPIYSGCRPSFTASAAVLPRAAGGVLLGKTVTTEFANRHPGPTANPHDPAFSPGGSSSGSATAVADFMVPLAIGTQTAAYCGVVALKPSFNMFAPAGMHPNTETLDTIGIMARSVGDIALFRAAIMAIPYEKPAMPERVPRLALCRTPHWDKAQAEGKAVLEDTAKRLAAAGAEVIEAELPASCAAVSEVQSRHSFFEAPRNHAPERYRYEALLSPALRHGRIAGGLKLTLDEFRAAWREAERMRAAAQEWAGGFDAILTLPAAGQAPRTLASTGDAIFNGLWTVLYMPCLTMPAGEGPDGLPVGIQLVGKRHADARLLDVGLWVENKLGARR